MNIRVSTNKFAQDNKPSDILQQLINVPLLWSQLFFIFQLFSLFSRLLLDLVRFILCFLLQCVYDIWFDTLELQKALVFVLFLSLLVIQVGLLLDLHLWGGVFVIVDDFLLLVVVILGYVELSAQKWHYWLKLNQWKYALFVVHSLLQWKVLVCLQWIIQLLYRNLRPLKSENLLLICYNLFQRLFPFTLLQKLNQWCLRTCFNLFLCQCFSLFLWL